MKAVVTASQRSIKIANRTTRLRKFWFAMASGVMVVILLQLSLYGLGKRKMESSTRTSSISDTLEGRSTADSQAMMCSGAAHQTGCSVRSGAT